MTDLRTGAARASAYVRPNFIGVAFGLAGAEEFCKDMEAELGVPSKVAATAKDLCAQSNCIFTQTPGGQTVVELEWLQPGTTIIA